MTQKDRRESVLLNDKDAKSDEKFHQISDGAAPLDSSLPLLDENHTAVTREKEDNAGCCHCKYSNALKTLLPWRPKRKEQKKMPSNKAGIFTFLSVGWITRLMCKAYKHGLTQDDVWDLHDEDSSAVCTRRLERIWTEEQRLATEQKRDAVFYKAAWRTVKTRVLVVMFVSILTHLIQFLGPSVLLKLTLDYVNEPVVDYTYASYIVAGVLVANISRCCLFNVSMVIGMHTATKLTGALQGILYRKLIRLKTGGEMLSAQVTNIVTNDLERVTEAIISSAFLSAAPILFVLNLAYSYYVIGPWCLMGLSVYFLFFPIMGFIAKIQSGLRQKTVKKTDKRVGLMTEILNSIQLIKMYAWEEAFSTKVSDVRNEEHSKLRKTALIQAVSSTAVPCVRVMAIMSTVLGVTLTGYRMTAAQIFTVASMFTSMQFTIGVLPFTVRSLSEGKVALGRIQKFLELPEYSKVDFGLMNNSLSLLIKNANFSWDVSTIDDPKQATDNKKKETPKSSPVKNGDISKELNNHTAEEVSEENSKETLLGINLSIEKGKLIGICGSIGSGKSSLISAVCGDMKMQTGGLQVNGRLALVTQQPWIFNASLRENILLGNDYNEKLFKEVVEVCGLTRDLTLLPDGDLSEIGERGVNLSGGQKQRVNLARAVYSDRDIYLLDDPLSAVDTKVAKHIFNRCITEQLAGKTILLVTHAVHFLEKCDEIVFMKRGRICERGSHPTLMQRQGEYFTMMGYDSNIKQQPNDVQTKSSFKRQFSRTISHEEERQQEDEIKLTTEETMEQGSIGAKVFLKFIEHSGGWCLAGLTFLGVICFSVSRLFSIMWLRAWLDAGDGEEQMRLENATLYGTQYTDHQLKGNITDNPNLWIFQLVYGLSFIGLFVLGISKGIAITFRILAGASRLHKEMFHSIMRAPSSFLDSTPTGRILSRFTKDMDEIDVRLPFFFEFVLDGLMAIAGQAILVCVMFPIFIGPFVVIGVLFVLIDLFMTPGVRDLKRIEGIEKSPIIQHIVSTTSGLPVIRTLGKEEVFIKRYHASVDKHSAAFFVFRLSGRWFTYRMDFLAILINLTITTICIFTKGSFSTATAGVALASVNSICAFISFTMRMKSEVVSRFTSVERMMAYAFGIESEAPLEVASSNPSKDWPASGRIQFQSVQMRYRPELPLVLKSLDIAIKPAEKIGVVGRTGAGKSSLISCLLRMVEIDGGSVLIDGLDISELGLKTLRSAISVIPQDPVLFQGTVRYNLDPFDDYRDEALWLALERSHLKKSIQKMPNQLLGEVQTGGRNFSVGEKQLICLTRALLRHSKILLLDEATASVDVETDHLIQQTIQEAFSDCTVLTIAHRLNTVTSYDRILVMDAGRMKEFDTPANLMQQPNSMFRDMMKAMNVYTVDHMRALM